MLDLNVNTLHLTVNVPAEMVVQLINAVNSAKETIMATQAEQTAQIVALKAQVDKTKAEILAKLAELQTAIDNAGNSTPEMDAAFSALTAAVQGVDDIVPDQIP